MSFRNFWDISSGQASIWKRAQCSVPEPEPEENGSKGNKMSEVKPRVLPQILYVYYKVHIKRGGENDYGNGSRFEELLHSQVKRLHSRCSILK